MYSFRCCVVAVTSAAICATAAAGSLGSIGPTHPIGEKDMLEWIEARVRAKVESGEVARQQKEQAAQIERKLLNPEPLRTVSKAKSNRTSYFDPTFTAPENVLDDKGAILVPAGTTVNPLDRIGMSRPLIFFDGRDVDQVAFAKKYIDSKQGTPMPVLVGGSFFELMKRWGSAVYFDQQGSLTRKFGIKHVPAVVHQEGRRLRIDEIAL
jgi:conjugal transfer pilus assembly protein TraW